MAAYFTFFIVSLLCISFTEAINGGFTVDLIHRRDSEKSPLFQQVNNALRRSIKRVSHFFPEASSELLADQSETEIVSAKGEYIMEYSLGTPPFRIFGIADTGSDLVWTQCKPCSQCYDQTAPLFDASKSRTYRNISCTAKLCLSVGPSVGQTSCDVDTSVCEYDIQYGDHSVSSGDIALETLTLGSTGGRHVAFPKTVFGCGHDNEGTFGVDTSGIVGLGRGAVSLVSQMGSTIDGKFSYCLVPLFSDKNSSQLSFGQNAVVSGRGTVSTPMVSKDPNTFYYLTLEGMSVGTKRLEFLKAGNGDSISGQKAVDEGNIIIDSGTTLTLLTDDFYSKLESEVASQIKLQRVQDPTQFLSLCYSSTSQYLEEAPIITAHFKGADLRLNPLNTFVKVAKGVACFAFRSISSGAIFGNLAQMNFQVGYDLQNELVSFKPTDCTKQ